MKALAVFMIAGICLLGAVGLCCSQEWSNEWTQGLRTPLAGDQRVAQAQKTGKWSRRQTKEQEKLAKQLVEAARAGDLSKVKRFLDRGADPNGTQWDATPLSKVGQKGHLAVARLLVDRGADVNLGWGTRLLAITGLEDTPLDWAAYRNDKDMVQFLIDRGADVNGGLWGAAAGGSEEMLSFCLDKGARYLDRPLAAASGGGDLKMMGFLFQRGARATGKTLRSAAASGHVPAIRLMLQSGVDVNDRDQTDGRTALMEAARSCKQAAIEFLLQKGADINVKSKGTFIKRPATALGYARNEAENPKNKVRAKCEAVVDLLRKHGGKE